MPKNEHDYGYFGKGSTGYAHYKRCFDRTFPAGKEQHYAAKNINHSTTQPTEEQQTHNKPLMRCLYWVGLAIAVAFFGCVIYVAIASIT